MRDRAQLITLGALSSQSGVALSGTPPVLVSTTPRDPTSASSAPLALDEVAWVGMALRSCTYALRLVTVFALAGALSGCVNGTEVDNTARNAAIYRSVIADVVDRSGVDLDGSEDLPVLFIEAFDANGIALEVQVDVVNSFIEQYEIRFIDDRDEAIVTDLAGLPVRANSLLIGLGPIVLDGTVDVRSELYVSADAVSAYRYTLAGRDDRWVTVGVPEEIEPEGFVSVS